MRRPQEWLETAVPYVIYDSVLLQGPLSQGHELAFFEDLEGKGETSSSRTPPLYTNLWLRNRLRSHEEILIEKVSVRLLDPMGCELGPTSLRRWLLDNCHLTFDINLLPVVQAPLEFVEPGIPIQRRGGLTGYVNSENDLRAHLKILRDQPKPFQAIAVCRLEGMGRRP